MRSLTTDELQVTEVVKIMYIEQLGETEGLIKYNEYIQQVYGAIETESKPKPQQKKVAKCHMCNGKVTQSAIDYCKDNGYKPTCYKCQEKRNINRYIIGKKNDIQEPTAH